MMARSGEGERAMAMRQYQDPFSLLDLMFDRMQRDFFGTSLFNAFLPQLATEAQRSVARVPRVQMQDTGDAIVVTAELPGIDAEDVQVELQDDMLTLRGETEYEEESNGERIERYISFYRQVRLPDDLDVDQAEASYRNGVLTIRFPKSAGRSNVRQIPVNAETSEQQQKQKAA